MPSAEKGLHQSERQFSELECSASSGFTWKRALLVTLCLLLSGCGSRPANLGPSIEFTRVPQADAAGLDKLDIIQGRVTGAHPGQQIVLYTRSGKMVGPAALKRAIHHNSTGFEVDKFNPPGVRVRGPLGRARVSSAGHDE